MRVQAFGRTGLLILCATTLISGGEWVGAPGAAERSPSGALSPTPVVFSPYDAMIFVMAAESGEDELVAQYLEAGFNPNSRDHNSNTALMAASLNGHASTMMILLKASADPHLANDNGLNAIHFASIRGDRRAAEIMLAIYPAPRETASTRR